MVSGARRASGSAEVRRGRGEDGRGGRGRAEDGQGHAKRAGAALPWAGARAAGLERPVWGGGRRWGRGVQGGRQRRAAVRGRRSGGGTSAGWGGRGRVGGRGGRRRWGHAGGGVPPCVGGACVGQGGAGARRRLWRCPGL
ncbi:uncharacterized protein [Miscanthus floridulus]|uniref:uncharacterized protein n=1 Tax=Miscanthus floridulus TaxID=154761 RepID=UPI0034576B14